MTHSKPTSPSGSLEVPKLTLDELRERMQTVSQEELAAGMRARSARRKEQLAKRLEPFKTPVTERTMRRSTRS